MNTLQSVAIAVATAFRVLAFCTGIKAACRKKRDRTKTIRQYMTDIWGKNEDLYIWKKGKSGGHAIAGNLLSLEKL